MVLFMNSNLSESIRTKQQVVSCPGYVLKVEELMEVVGTSTHHSMEHMVAMDTCSGEGLYMLTKESLSDLWMSRDVTGASSLQSLSYVLTSKQQVQFCFRKYFSTYKYSFFSCHYACTQVIGCHVN